MNIYDTRTTRNAIDDGRVLIDFQLPISSNPDLDYLLGQIAEALQLSQTQYDKAQSHYRSVGEWLGGPGSPLAAFAPRIYAQVAMALATTVRPYGRVEYDIDSVFELISWPGTAMD